MNDFWSILIPSIIAIIPSVLTYLYMKKELKHKAPIETRVANGSYTKDIAQSYKDLVEANEIVVNGLRLRIDDLETEIKELKIEYEELKENQRILIKQLKDAGIEPQIKETQ